MTTSQQLYDEILAVTVWKQGGQRAPHKPLLLLLALADLQKGRNRLIPYDDIDRRLKQLLMDFGPPRKVYQPEYPFWHLQNDGDFWEIPEHDDALDAISSRKRQKDVPPKILRGVDAHGGFTQAAYELLCNEPALVNRIAMAILDEHFPKSLHEPILDAVAMPWIVEKTWRQSRSPAFRDLILRLYEHRCAICGFDGRLGSANLGLEAAHVKWRSHGGPDTNDNGLLLCALHHQMLDRGALGISEDRTVLVSQHVHGGSQVRSTLINYSGMPLSEPLEDDALIARPLCAKRSLAFLAG